MKNSNNNMDSKAFNNLNFNKLLMKLHSSKVDPKVVFHKKGPSLLNLQFLENQV